ncbi:MAG: VRR-NUC domain-containing protein [Pseudomonadota bacterium]
MSEHDLQRAVARYLDYALRETQAVWFAVPNGGARNVNVARKLRAEGVKPGVADIVLVWQGRAIGIELKTQKGRQSTAQKEWAEAFTLAGGVYHVCRSVDAVADILIAMGLPIRARLKAMAA